MLKKFALNLLHEVASECDDKILAGFELDNQDLFVRAADEITESIDVLVEG